MYCRTKCKDDANLAGWTSFGEPFKPENDNACVVCQIRNKSTITELGIPKVAPPPSSSNKSS